MKRYQFACAALAVTGYFGTGTARAADTNVVNIGYTGPLSGGAAQYGLDVQHGLQMAIDEINADGGFPAGGKNYMLKLISLDDEYHPNESAINAKRLLQQNNTPIIVRPHSGGIWRSKASMKKARSSSCSARIRANRPSSSRTIT